MSRRGCDGGRKKGVIDSRRGVNCPVSDCDVSGRIDYVKKHFNKLIVWSKTHESEAAEESEIDFKNASKDAKPYDMPIYRVIQKGGHKLKLTG